MTWDLFKPWRMFLLWRINLSYTEVQRDLGLLIYFSKMPLSWMRILSPVLSKVILRHSLHDCPTILMLYCCSSLTFWCILAWVCLQLREGVKSKTVSKMYLAEKFFKTCLNAFALAPLKLIKHKHTFRSRLPQCTKYQFMLLLLFHK